MLIAANYHYIRPVYEFSYPGIHGTSPEKFEAQIDLMASVAPFYGLPDLIDIQEKNKKVPDTGWILTFDDGLAEQYIYALPILKRKGIPAIFFVSTKPLVERKFCEVHRIQLLRANNSSADILESLKSTAIKMNLEFPLPDKRRGQEIYVYDNPEDAGLKYLLNYQLDKTRRSKLLNGCFEQLMDVDEITSCTSFYMDVNMVKELHEINCLGSHCHSHIRLSELADNDLYNEINDATIHFSDIGISGLSAIAYPYGTQDAISRNAVDMAEQLLFKLGFTMERAVISDFNKPLLLPRFSNDDLPGGKSECINIKDIFNNSFPSQKTS